MTATSNTGTKINPVLRTDNQFLGRPWTRMAPTHEALATFTRTIEDYHYLRPIPTGQINAMMMDEAEKKAYQNPGYGVE